MSVTPLHLDIEKIIQISESIGNEAMVSQFLELIEAGLYTELKITSQDILKYTEMELFLFAEQSAYKSLALTYTIKDLRDYRINKK